MPGSLGSFCWRYPHAKQADTRSAPRNGTGRRRATMLRRVLTLFAIGCSALIAAVAISACGGSAGSDSSGKITATSNETSEDAAGVDYESELARLYKGTYEKPQGGPVTPPPGKNIWVISVGQSIETAQAATKATEEAGS